VSRTAPDPGQPRWPVHHDDAPPAEDPRSLRRGLVAGGAVVLMTLAVLLAGPWSTQSGGTVLALGWIAAVALGSLAYRGRPPVVVPLTRVAVVLGLVALVLALFLLFLGLQVRQILAGMVVFGSGGEGCTVEGDAAVFAPGQPRYQVAHLSRLVEPGEAVTMRMTGKGAVVAERSGPTDFAFDCLGTPLEPLPPGSYQVSVLVDGEVLAEGSFEVEPGAS
jgi:hypothetical protein